MYVVDKNEAIREAYKMGGAKAARAMREELKNVEKRVDPNSNPKCPTCSSKNIKRIDPGGKVIKIAALGIFGLGDVHKIFRCKDCGYKW